jgi:hypothetical protein
MSERRAAGEIKPPSLLLLFLAGLWFVIEWPSLL